MYKKMMELRKDLKSIELALRVLAEESGSNFEDTLNDFDGVLCDQNCGMERPYIAIHLLD